MKENICKFLRITMIIIISLTLLSLISTEAYADPSKSHGFAGYDDETAEKEANEEIRNQEQEENASIEKSNNNYLLSLSVSGYELFPNFDKQTTNYEIVDYKEDSINITAISEDERSTVRGAGEIKLNEGENNIKIEVAAETGTVRTYTIKVNKITEENITDKTQENVVINDEKDAKNENIVIAAIVAIVVIILIIILMRKSKK